jgi:hypothetical protein
MEGCLHNDSMFPIWIEFEEEQVEESRELIMNNL